MYILRIIEQDIRFINETISLLQETNENLKIAPYQRELDRLNTIINSKVVPLTYKSKVQNKIFTTEVIEESKGEIIIPFDHVTIGKKFSRKVYNTPHSWFTIFKPNQEQIPSFYVRNTNHNIQSPIVQKIKQAFDDENTVIPKYALKIINPDYATPSYQYRFALRAAFCHRLLGRTAYAFKNNNKHYLLTDWMPGQTLEEISREEICAIDIKTRIKMTLSLFEEVLVLHHSNIMHCNITPQNIIRNGESFNLLNLESVRIPEQRIADNAWFILSMNFLDPSTHWYITNHPDAVYKILKKSVDVYMLALTLTFIFPDIIMPTPGMRNITMGYANTTYSFESIIISDGNECDNINI